MGLQALRGWEGTTRGIQMERWSLSRDHQPNQFLKPPSPCWRLSSLSFLPQLPLLWYFSQPGTSRFLFFLQNLLTLLPSEQARQSAVFALQQPLPPSPLWYFSQPCTPPKKSVDGFFLQYSFSLKPAAQERHLALFALQQGNGLPPPPFWYFSQPVTYGFLLQYSFSLKPCLQDSHWASYAEQQIGGPGCSILKARAC